MSDLEIIYRICKTQKTAKLELKISNIVQGYILWNSACLRSSNTLDSITNITENKQMILLSQLLQK